MKLTPQTIKLAALHAGEAIRKSSPTILTGFAVAGVVSTVVLTVRATPKAVDILEKEKARRDALMVKEDTDYDDCFDEPKDPDICLDLRPWEVVGLTWKCFVPVAISTGATIACIIAANTINAHRTATLMALYSGTTAAYEQYQKKVKEEVGERKEAKIREAVNEDILRSRPVDGTYVISTGLGDTLCYDRLSGRYFTSDIERIRQAQNDFNQQLICEYILSLNDLYTYLRLPTIALGDDIGWNANRMLEFHFMSKLASDGRPCLVLDYATEPGYDYRSF